MEDIAGLFCEWSVYECFVTRSQVYVLTHWGRVMHRCVGNLTIIGSDNSLSPGCRQAIIWTNVGILLIGPIGANASEMLIEFHTFSRKSIWKCRLENGGHFVSASMCQHSWFTCKKRFHIYYRYRYWLGLNTSRLMTAIKTTIWWHLVDIQITIFLCLIQQTHMSYHTNKQLWWSEYRIKYPGNDIHIY